MRIEPTGERIAVGPASPDRPNNPGAPSTRPGADRVELSALFQAAVGSDPARVEEIQAGVSSGTYQLNAGELSRHIVDYYLIPMK